MEKSPHPSEVCLSKARLFVQHLECTSFTGCGFIVWIGCNNFSYYDIKSVSFSASGTSYK